MLSLYLLLRQMPYHKVSQTPRSPLLSAKSLPHIDSRTPLIIRKSAALPFRSSLLS